jgi:hypothetical protein
MEMVKTDHLEVWNLTDNGIARSGCVDIFNIVGRILVPDSVRQFVYELNGGPEMPIFFARGADAEARLRRAGDFNIDTIGPAHLAALNRLSLRIKRADGAEHRRDIIFRLAPFEQIEPSFRLSLAAKTGAEQVGQVVEGPWRISEDGLGCRCLEIAPEHAGYDRIILFGRNDWSASYSLRARLAVTSVAGLHNVGLVFKWNPHERGDGTFLPKKWSSGLGYYCSYGRHPGIRIRFGVRAHYDEAGKIRGEYVLAHRPLATTRRQALLNRLRRRSRVPGLSRRVTELCLHQDYCFRMLVHPKRFALTVWPAASAEPPPQLVVSDPIDPLPQGSVGILAYHVGVRLYEFEVRPVSDSPD